jgi:hypothetical protein
MICLLQVFIDRETQESLVYVSFKHAPMRITTAAEYLAYLEVGGWVGGAPIAV